jgi:SAM-dependent methyltransferase
MPAGSRDDWPRDYERGRPGWPREVLTLPQVTSNATVLELGAGTGKLTRLLVPAFDRVLAVEPADAMRRILVSYCPEALAGTAEEIPLADDSVDAIFVAEAFHHFAQAQAVAEMCRVLRPSGAVVLLWNVPAGEWEPSIAAVEDYLGERAPKPEDVSFIPLDLDGPHYTSGSWRAALAGTPLEALREARFPKPQTLDPDGLVAYFASMKWLADLSDEVRLPVLRGIRERLHADQYRRLWETRAHSARLE